MKRISFIITYYNEPLEMLTECIQSVLALPLHPGEREILLIDDGSAIPAPKFGGVTIIRQENQGLSAARNKGIELAQGEYIQFLDADDFLLDEAYRKVLDMQLSIRPDILMFGFTHDIPKEDKLKSVEYFHCGTDLLRTHNIRGSACCYLFRKSMLGDLRFFPGIMHEDELFTPQLLLKAGLVLMVRCSPYYYRIRTNTITHQQNPSHNQKRLKDTLLVISELNRLSQSAQGKERMALQRRVSQLSMDCIYDCWRLTHSPGEVLSYLRSLKEISLYPLPLRCYTLKYWFFAFVVNCLCIFL